RGRPVGAQRLYAGVNGDVTLVVRGDDRRRDEQRLTEGPLTFRSAAVFVLDVHHGIGPGLQLGEDAALQIVGVRAGATAGNDIGRKACGAKVGDDRRRASDYGVVGHTSGRSVRDVLQLARVDLNAGKPQPAGLRHEPREVHHLRWVRAGAVRARIDVDD